MGYAQPVIKTYITMLENCYIKVRFIRHFLRMSLKIEDLFQRVHLSSLKYTCWPRANATVLAFLQRCSSIGHCQIKFMVYLPFVVQYRMLFLPSPPLFISSCFVLYQAICRTAIFLPPAPLSNISLQEFPRHFDLIQIRRFPLAKRMKLS